MSASKERDALLFLIAITIMYETVHYGDDQDGEDYTGEKKQLGKPKKSPSLAP